MARHALVFCLALPSLLAVAPAQANHELVAQHESPRVARAGEPLELHVAVASNCVPLCGGIRAVVSLTTTLGRQGEVVGSFSPRPGGLLILTIPEDLMVGCCYGLGSLRYWIEIRHAEVYPVHDRVVRLPDEGWHEVVVFG